MGTHIGSCLPPSLPAPSHIHAYRTSVLCAALILGVSSPLSFCVTRCAVDSALHLLQRTEKENREESLFSQKCCRQVSNAKENTTRKQTAPGREGRRRSRRAQLSISFRTLSLGVYFLGSSLPHSAVRLSARVYVRVDLRMSFPLSLLGSFFFRFPVLSSGSPLFALRLVFLYRSLPPASRLLLKLFLRLSCAFFFSCLLNHFLVHSLTCS